MQIAHLSLPSAAEGLGAGQGVRHPLCFQKLAALGKGQQDWGQGGLSEEML